MPTRAFQISILLAGAAAALHSQPNTLPGTQPPLNGAVYWSAKAPDCSSLAGESPVPIVNASGTIGYSCYVSGTFVWVAAGGGWSTAIRVAAPASGAIGVNFSFYDTSGNNLKLDTVSNGSTAASGDDLNFALSANQPAEIDLLGAGGDAPEYAATATGTVYAVFYCPDATTCANVLPQLLHSALPAMPWSMSVPIAWDTDLATRWSVVGLDDGGARRLSLVIYNEDITPASYKISVFDSAGKIVASGSTPFVPPLQSLPSGAFGEGGVYAAMLSDVVTKPLPPGPFKLLIDGESIYCAVGVIQVDGPSATALQVAYESQADLIPGEAARVAKMRRSRVASSPKPVFRALPVGADRN